MTYNVGNMTDNGGTMKVTFATDDCEVSIATDSVMAYDAVDIALRAVTAAGWNRENVMNAIRALLDEEEQND